MDSPASQSTSAPETHDLQAVEQEDSEAVSKANQPLPDSVPFLKSDLVVRLLPTLVLTLLTGWWSVVGRIPVRVVGQSVLIQPRSIIPFQPRGSGGQVLKILVEPGDRVRVGDVLAILDLPELQEQLATQQQKLDELEAENRAITDAQNRRSALQEQTLELESFSVRQQIQSNLQAIEANRIVAIAIDKQRQAYQERVIQLDEFIALTASRLEAAEELIQGGALARFSADFVNADNQYQQSQNERTRLFAALEGLNAEDEELLASSTDLEAQNKDLGSQLEDLRTQSANLELGDLQADVQRQNQIDDLKRDILNLETQIDTESQVVSTYDGVVFSVSANPGQYLQVGDPVGTLRIETSEALEVTAYGFFTPEDANRIRPDMAAVLTPHLLTNRRFGGTREQYGGIPSTVTGVSPKTVTVQEVTSIVGDSDLANTLIQNPVPYAIPDNGRAQNLPVVQVELNLETNPKTPSGYQWTQGRGPNAKLPEGAIGEARVTVETRSLFSYAIASFRWLTGIYRD